MYCMKCGGKIPDKGRFCPACGAAAPRRPPTPPYQAYPPPQPHQAYPPQYPYPPYPPYPPQYPYPPPQPYPPQPGYPGGWASAPRPYYVVARAASPLPSKPPLKERLAERWRVYAGQARENRLETALSCAAAGAVVLGVLAMLVASP